MNINELTVGEIKEIADLAKALFAGGDQPYCSGPAKPTGESKPYVVCTDKRGVVFGYTDDVNARPIVLSKARMCLYWSKDVGGVFGLAEVGPTADCRISAVAPSISLDGVTAIMTVAPQAAVAWVKAKVQGR
jgi:hypothetical protein